MGGLWILFWKECIATEQSQSALAVLGFRILGATAKVASRGEPVSHAGDGGGRGGPFGPTGVEQQNLQRAGGARLRNPPGPGGSPSHPDLAIPNQK